MRAALCVILALVPVFIAGCHHNVRRAGPCGCQNCGHASHGHHGGAPTHVARIPHGEMADQMMGPGGPPSPTLAYPYYTTRAPRDFLLDNPPSIGP